MSESRILLIQCCNLPQFFYVAEKLLRLHPKWILDALFCAPSRVDFYLERFPYFERVHFLENNAQSLPDGSDAETAVFPLLNRGYWKIKRAARGLSLVNLEVNYQGELHPLLSRRLYLSGIRTLHPPDRDFLAYVPRFPLPPLGRRILLVESCPSTVSEKFQERLDELIPKDARITRIQKDPMKEVGRLRTHHFEGSVVFFSGEPGFALMRLLPFLLWVPRVVVVTETGQFFDADVRRLGRFLWERIRYGVVPEKPPPRILLVQTETAPHVQHVIGQLKEKKLFPRSEIILLCRQEDRGHFESNRQVDRLMTYGRTGIRDHFRLWKRLRKLGPDVLCAIFSGRPYFRKPKLLFFSLSARRRVVFNAQLDCYDLKPRTFFRIFKRDPLLLEPETSRVSLNAAPRVLMLQTEHPEKTIQAIEVLTSEEVAPRAHVSVFCSAKTRAAFLSLPQVQETVVYDPAKPLEGLRTLWQTARSGYDIVAGNFSGRPIFWKQKCLFFLLPVRYQLVFNEHLECFYLNWRNAHLLFHHRFQVSIRTIVRKVAKVFLFLPRFAFLLVWVAFMKLKRVDSIAIHQTPHSGSRF